MVIDATASYEGSLRGAFRIHSGGFTKTQTQFCKTLDPVSRKGPPPAYASPGERSGRLTATGRTEFRVESGHSRLWHEWACDCGGMKWAKLHVVRSGNTRSCGCLHRDTVSVVTGDLPADTSPTMKGGRPRNHGMSKTPLYGRWAHMRNRCERPNNSRYRFYGGRGIRVCDEWSADFLAFREWALTNGWSDGCSLELDRIDPDGPYSPANCRWIDKRTNVRRAKQGLGRLGIGDELELRLRSQSALENVEPTELLIRAVEHYLDLRSASVAEGGDAA